MFSMKHWFLSAVLFNGIVRFTELEVTSIIFGAAGLLNTKIEEFSENLIFATLDGLLTLYNPPRLGIVTFMSVPPVSNQ